jgi:hypothetical protein
MCGSYRVPIPFSTKNKKQIQQEQKAIQTSKLKDQK